jgi:hypothetical protein
MNEATGRERSYLESDWVRLGFPVFKYGIYLLLGLNVYFFMIHATLDEALDSAGWIVLIGVMEYETRSLDQDYANSLERWIILALKLVAYVIVVRAWWFYWSEGMWLDFVNATTWLIVCATLEYDVYWPGEFRQGEWRKRNILKTVLYAILLVCAVIWGTEGDVLNFYDAFLWILAFFVIELNVFGFEQPKQQAAPVATSG